MYARQKRVMEKIMEWINHIYFLDYMLTVAKAAFCVFNFIQKKRQSGALMG